MTEDYKKYVKDYIKKAKQTGYNDGIIKKKLHEAGYDPKLVQDAYDEVKGSSTQEYNWKKIALFSVAVLAIVVISIFTLNQISMTRERFIEKANLCEKAEFISTIEGTTYKFLTENCVFKKKIIKLDKYEPEEVNDLFLNEELTCNYNEGEFNTNWIDYLTKDIENCEGELKEIIEEILTFKT